MAASINDFAFDYEQFDFAHLRSVVPIAQTVQLGEISLTVMSLELYVVGFAANLRFEQESDPHDDPAQQVLPLLFQGMPAVDAIDDGGTRYESRMRAGYGGGGGPSGHHAVQVHNFVPSLAPEARTLTLTIAYTTTLGWDADGRPTWGTDDIITGPFEATITLPEDR